MLRKKTYKEQAEEDYILQSQLKKEQEDLKILARNEEDPEEKKKIQQAVSDLDRLIAKEAETKDFCAIKNMVNVLINNAVEQVIKISIFRKKEIKDLIESLQKSASISDFCPNKRNSCTKKCKNNSECIHKMAILFSSYEYQRKEDSPSLAEVEYEEIWHWIMGTAEAEGDFDIFSFTNCAEIKNIDPSRFRKKIREITQSPLETLIQKYEIMS